MKKYVADFETSTEKWLTIDNKARVWASCIATVEEDPKVLQIDNNIDDFMKYVISLGNVEIFFHNLKYDGEYILSWLFENGYKYDDKPRSNKTFSCVISDTGLWYEIIITHKVYNKKYIRTRFRDSLKKIPLKVSQIAKAFKLPIQKGEIDYDQYRPVGYQLNDEEISYISRDCLIVAQALYMQFEKGLDKMTIGSDAMAYFKMTIGGQKAFEYLFPKLPIAVDNDFRLSYKGGFTSTNKKYRNKILNGFNVDVNSLYPAVMYGKMGLLPYGVPRRYQGKYIYDKDYPLYIQKIAVSFKVKKDHIPTIQLKNNLMFMPTQYIENSNGVIDMCVTNVDLELMFEHYDIDYIEYICGYKFKGASNIFRPYIDHFMEIKANSTGGTRQLAKLMLNSLYGKFATNPRKLSKYPVIENGEIVLKLGKEVIKDPVYTALGSFVTAYARRWTITSSQKLYKYWIYSDTDSMYLTGISEEEVAKLIEIHPSNLGAWKVEHHFAAGKWLRPKTYILDSIEDGLSIACAGMPDNVKDKILSNGRDKAFKLFTYGATFDGKLQPKRVNGGTVLCDTSFTISTVC